MNPARIAISFGALLLMTAAVACSSGTSSSDKTATAAAKGGANSTAAATRATTGSPAATGSPASGAPKSLTITAKDFSFSASSIDVSKGDTLDITFQNSGAATHTLSFFSDDAYTKPIAGADTGNVSGGSTKTLTVTAGDGLYYRCNIHPTQMQGEIELQ